MAKQKFTPRKMGAFLDFIHVVSGAGVILLAIFAIADPQKYKVFFPVIFFLASVINICTSWYQFRMYPRNRKKHLSGWGFLLTGIPMLALAVISAISIWGSY